MNLSAAHASKLRKCNALYVLGAAFYIGGDLGNQSPLHIQLVGMGDDATVESMRIYSYTENILRSVYGTKWTDAITAMGSAQITGAGLNGSATTYAALGLLVAEIRSGEPVTAPIVNNPIGVIRTFTGLVITLDNNPLFISLTTEAKSAELRIERLTAIRESLTALRDALVASTTALTNMGSGVSIQLPDTQAPLKIETVVKAETAAGLLTGVLLPKEGA